MSEPRASEPPPAERPVTDPIRALAASMRAAGVRVGVAELLTAHRALAVVDPLTREEVRLALRAVLCASRADMAPFEVGFRAVFGAPVGAAATVAADPFAELGEVMRAALPHAAVPGSAPPPPAHTSVRDLHPVPAAWSETELLRETDFAAYDDAMLAAARPALERLARRGPRRRSRRTAPSPRERRHAHAPDLRRTIRASLRTSGELVRVCRRAPVTRPRRLVLVCDVSGSMAPYARVLLRYLHACVASHRPVEAFVFGTRLTRITPELARRDPDAALARAAAAVTDVRGGTRIGAALATLNRDHGRRLGRGSVAVILSDGWDRGEPELLGAEIARLRRTAHRLIWLNPLAAHPDYAPLTRGMRAAVPHTDELLAGNSLASLERLAEILEAT